MIKHFVLILVMLGCISCYTLSQDTIVYKDGEVLAAIISQLNKNEVVFRIFNDLSKREATSKIQLIKSIKYQDGRIIEFLNGEQRIIKPINDSLFFIETEEDIMNIAIRDANLRHNSSEVVLGTTFSSIGCLPLGIGYGIFAMSKKPVINIYEIEEKYRTNQTYLKHYTAEARKIRNSRVLLTIGIATSIAACLLFMTYGLPENY